MSNAPSRKELSDMLDAAETWVIALLRAGTGAEMAGNSTGLRAAVRQAREMLLDAIERMDR